MAIEDVDFTISAAQISDPQALTSSPLAITLTNNGPDDLVGLGLYIAPTTWGGDLANPPSAPPETDYQDLLSWGDAAKADGAGGVIGGLVIAINAFNDYITRSQGADVSTKVGAFDLAAGASIVATMTMETPPSVSGRTVYVDIRVA